MKCKYKVKRYVIVSKFMSCKYLRKGDTRIQQICGTLKKFLWLKWLKHRWFLGEKSFSGFSDHSGGPWGTFFI